MSRRVMGLRGAQCLPHVGDRVFLHPGPNAFGVGPTHRGEIEEKLVERRPSAAILQQDFNRHHGASENGGAMEDARGALDDFPQRRRKVSASSLLMAMALAVSRSVAAMNRSGLRGRVTVLWIARFHRSWLIWRRPTSPK